LSDWPVCGVLEELDVLGELDVDDLPGVSEGVSNCGWNKGPVILFIYAQKVKTPKQCRTSYFIYLCTKSQNTKAMFSNCSISSCNFVKELYIDFTSISKQSNQL